MLDVAQIGRAVNWFHGNLLDGLPVAQFVGTGNGFGGGLPVGGGCVRAVGGGRRGGIERELGVIGKAHGGEAFGGRLI